MSNELEWRAITNTNYLISENGDIFSKRSQKILEPQINKGGYLQLTLYIDGDKVNCRVHRLVGKAFLGNSSSLQINHKDGNKLNNHYTNLEYVTAKDNINHAVESGLIPIGSLKPGAKLNEEIVKRIKELMVDGLDDSEIAELVGTVTATVSKIRHKKRWTHVCPELEFPQISPGLAENSRGKAKLSVEDVQDIRKLYKKGASLADLGRLFKVHSGTIDSIVKYKTWKNY